MVIRKHAPYRKINDRILGVAGPPVLQAAAEECFEDGSIKDILKFTQVACISMGKSCQMNGNVHHDHRNPEYIKALKSIKTPHYRHGRGLAAIMIDRLKSYYQNK